MLVSCQLIAVFLSSFSVPFISFPTVKLSECITDGFCVADVPMSSKVMKEEIFGPLLPVHKYKDIDTVIAHVKANEKPLTLYIFARNQRLIDR